MMLMVHVRELPGAHALVCEPRGCNAWCFGAFTCKLLLLSDVQGTNRFDFDVYGIDVRVDVRVDLNKIGGFNERPEAAFQARLSGATAAAAAGVDRGSGSLL